MHGEAGKTGPGEEKEKEPLTDESYSGFDWNTGGEDRQREQDVPGYILIPGYF